jgi:aryl-alcohol dehydrogenase-like predicted oxidoreductase
VALLLRRCCTLLTPAADTANNYNTEAAVGEGVRKTDIPREQLFITSASPHACASLASC